jgi:hypothetical protein
MFQFILSVLKVMVLFFCAAVAIGSGLYFGYILIIGMIRLYHWVVGWKVWGRSKEWLEERARRAADKAAKIADDKA